MRASLGLIAVVAVAGCSGTVPLARSDRERLAATPAIPVAYRPAPSPWVDCPNDEGYRLYNMPGAAAREPPRPRASPAGMIPTDAAALEVRLASGPTGGDVWQAIVDDYTAKLRQSPPVDPARATGEALVEAARSASGPPLGPTPEPAKRTDAAALASQFGAGPVLVVEAPRFVLVGCFYTFQPWFDARATLVDPATGRVLWRDVCRDLYPPDRPGAGASPPQLEADGGAIYRRALEDRARACAARLLASLTRPAPGP